MHPIPGRAWQSSPASCSRSSAWSTTWSADDIGGASMESILGIAMSLMFYVLMTGSPRG